MTKPKTARDVDTMMRELIESLAQASGGAWHLVHQMNDPRWIAIKNMLDGTKQAVISYVTPVTPTITRVR